MASASRDVLVVIPILYVPHMLSMLAVGCLPTCTKLEGLRLLTLASWPQRLTSCRYAHAGKIREASTVNVCGPWYTRLRLHVNISPQQTASSFALCLQAGVGAFAGAFADDLISNRGWSIKATRRWLQGVGMLGPAVTLLLATTMPSNPNGA